MSRLLLAIRCFLAVLFTLRLPREALKLLPPPEIPPAAEPQEAEVVVPASAITQPRAVAVEPAPAPAAPPPVVEDKEASAELRRRGAIQMLALLQREGRLIDFLMEELGGYSDAQIGAAVRDIHKGCRRGLLEHVPVTAVRPEPDEAAVRVEEGYDPSRVRLIGNVTGRPPFHGTLKHHGWVASAISLPELPASHDPLVINPAEVELGG